MVQVYLGDDVIFNVDTDIETMRENFRLATAQHQLLEITDLTGRVVVVNPRKLVWLEAFIGHR